MSLLTRAEKVCVSIGMIASSLTYVGMNYPHLANQASGEYSEVAFLAAVASNFAFPSVGVGNICTYSANKILYKSDSLLNDENPPKVHEVIGLQFIGAGPGILTTLAASFFIAQANIQDEQTLSLETESSASYDLLIPRAYP